MVATWLGQASLLQFPSTVGQGGSDFFVLCFCLDNVEEARRLGFLMGACSARCEDVFSSFRTSSRRVGLVCLTLTLLEMIFFFMVMSVCVFYSILKVCSRSGSAHVSSLCVFRSDFVGNLGSHCC